MTIDRIFGWLKRKPQKTPSPYIPRTDKLWNFMNPQERLSFLSRAARVANVTVDKNHHKHRWTKLSPSVRNMLKNYWSREVNPKKFPSINNLFIEGEISPRGKAPPSLQAGGPGFESRQVHPLVLQDCGQKKEKEYLDVKIRKIVQVGDSVSLILPPKYLEFLGVGLGDAVEIIFSNDTIKLIPLSKEEIKKRFLGEF